MSIYGVKDKLPYWSMCLVSIVCLVLDVLAYLTRMLSKDNMIVEPDVCFCDTLFVNLVK